MKKIISNELISTVLKKDIRYVYGKDAIEIGDYIIDHNTEIAFAYLFRNKEFEDYINIHELAYMCKEWATTKGFSVLSCKLIVTDNKGNRVSNYWWCAYLGLIEGEEPNLKIDFSANSEPEAVFKACQYILDKDK